MSTVASLRDDGPTSSPTRREGLPDEPYPGLRPFEEGDAVLFFGRTAQIDALADRLETGRFVAVIGASGSGKSSLVRAGLVPALRRSLLWEAGPAWQTTVFVPGVTPLANLAAELADAIRQAWSSYASAETTAETALDKPESKPLTVPVVDKTQIETDLRDNGSVGLIVALRRYGLPEAVNLLLVADQFEEVFRLREDAVTARSGSDAETKLFASLLLAAAAQRELPVYVVLTMRSEYIGQCAAFPGMTEAMDTGLFVTSAQDSDEDRSSPELHSGLFVTPRLDSDQLRQVIIRPAALFGVQIEPALVKRLLSEVVRVRDEADHLPLLQHALMRTWQARQERLARQTNANLALTLQDYLAIDWPDGVSPPLSDPDSQNRKRISLWIWLLFPYVGFARWRRQRAAQAAAKAKATTHRVEGSEGGVILDRALDRHAQMLYDALTPSQQCAAERLFR